MQHRSDDDARLQRRLGFTVSTLPPFTLLTLAVVAWFADRPARFVLLGALFLLNIGLFMRLSRHRPWAGSLGSISINLSLFATANVMGGPGAPGWALFFMPVAASVLAAPSRGLQKFLLMLTVLTCFVSSMVAGHGRATVVGITFLVFGASVILFRINTYLHLQQEIIDRERGQSDALLELLMPPNIAARIKKGEQGIADRFDPATILFADIVGFTPLSQELSPERTVELLDRLFTVFDRCIEARGLEKIKTIGDAYMVASGLNGAPDDPEAVADLGFALQDAIAAFNAEEGTDLKIRVGINRGPVVAGVVGSRRFNYDAWSDAVNTAARMESHGVPGEVQVTAVVRDALTGLYETEARGPIDVKGKGPMEVFLLRRPAASVKTPPPA